MGVVRSRGRAWIVAIALVVASFLVAGLAPEHASAVERTGRRVRMVALTNEDRERRDRHDLGFAARLSRYAKRHSARMARKGYIYHSTPEQLRRALGDYRWSIGGENVGVGASLESLQDAFMTSRAHRENILRPTFRRMAVGIVREDDTLWLTVIFYG